jgi:protein-L-isoaspartate(D-aspartate) O-methyltransferase
MSGPDADAFAPARAAMVETQLRRRGIRDERVLAAMRRVPRHEFVPEPLRREAYEDNPLPIGEGQTISQPFIVAAMLEALVLQPLDSVLDVGTGSGYQAALLAELVAQVVSIERHASLAAAAREVLARLGYQNIEIVVGDGSEGYAARAPYDAIIVSAAAPAIPQRLFDQLREGGRMIVPVGSAYAQELRLVHKIEGRPRVSSLDGCRFVPLIGSEGFQS